MSSVRIRPGTLLIKKKGWISPAFFLTPSRSSFRPLPSPRREVVLRARYPAEPALRCSSHGAFAPSYPSLFICWEGLCAPAFSSLSRPLEGEVVLRAPLGRLILLSHRRRWSTGRCCRPEERRRSLRLMRRPHRHRRRCRAIFLCLRHRRCES